MRLPPETIALGDKSWRVRPLTVAQVQGIEPLLLASAEARTGTVAGAVAILRVALARDHAEALAGLDEIEASAADIAAAMGQVLRLGGFLPKEGASPGEAPAGSVDPDRPAGDPAEPTGRGSAPA